MLVQPTNENTLPLVHIIYGLTAMPIHRMEHLENTEQLCKSSLQCLISTNCHYRQALQTGIPVWGLISD